MEQIKVVYEDLPGVFSPQEALAPGAINVHENANLLSERTLLKGNPTQALQEAEIIITNTFQTQMVEHAYLEPEAGTATYEDGKITMWIPSKHAHFDHREMARILHIPPDHVRVILTTIGGSFGDKQCISPGYYAALASFKTGRPCKMVYDRPESFAVSAKRHPCLIRHTLGASKTGRVTAMEIEIIADTGAYSSYGPSILVRSMAHATGPYEIPHVSVNAKAVYTNNPTGGAMRGFGVPQVILASESQMDILAERLQMDPFDIRLKNALKPGAVTATGQTLGTSVGLAETFEKLRAEIAGKGLPPSSETKRYGWGIAAMHYGIGLTGLPNPGVCRIEVQDSGVFTIFLGCGDVGQGSATVMTQIAAEVLKIPLDRFALLIGDTDRCPDSGTSTASRVTYIVGRAVQAAAEDLLGVLQATAAAILKLPREQLVFDGDVFYSPQAPDRKVELSEAIEGTRDREVPVVGEGKFDPDTTSLDPQTGQGAPYATYAFAVQGAMVCVDMDSGKVEVQEIFACHDVGKALNPRSVAGQIEGGISMGLGYGLTEEASLKEGVIINPRFSQYLIPTALDVPEVRSFLVEEEEPSGPFGAKGVGEPALVPTAPAVVNAIAAATGVRPMKLPVTPQALQKLLKESEPGP
jgi:CO/xanthine dehydrogenase Mo-binding subunit